MKLLDLESVNCSLVTPGHRMLCCMPLSCCHHGAAQPKTAMLRHLSEDSLKRLKLLTHRVCPRRRRLFGRRRP